MEEGRRGRGREREREGEGEREREREGEGEGEREKVSEKERERYQHSQVHTCVFHRNNVYTYTVFMALFSNIPSARSSTVSTRLRSSNVLIYSNRNMHYCQLKFPTKSVPNLKMESIVQHILDIIYMTLYQHMAN
jgi:hypothetical protein